MSALAHEVDGSYSVKFVSHRNSRGTIVYAIEVCSPDGRKWQIEKRYSEVRELHEQLRVSYAAQLPPIPGKRIFGNQDPTFVLERQAGLQNYIDGVLKLGCAKHSAMQNFLYFPLSHQTMELGRAVVQLARSQRKAAVSAPPRCANRHETVPRPSVTLEAVCPPGGLDSGLSAAEEGSAASTRRRSFRAARASGRSLSNRVLPPDVHNGTATQCRGATRRRSRGPPHDGFGLELIEEADDESCPRGLDGDQFCIPKTEGCTKSASLLLPDAFVATEVGRDEEEKLAARISESTEASERTCIESSLLPFPPCGNSWEWPLSRDEKKTRVMLIDRSMERLDRTALLEELAKLRKESGPLTV